MGEKRNIVSQIINFLQTVIIQFAGGPGPAENNLVRFGLPSLFWAVLLIVAWNRQRQDRLPRERWLLWGFGLGLFREMFMFVNVAFQVMNAPMSEMFCTFIEPFEHTLSLASTLVIAGSFLRYVLDDATIARRYIQTGFGATCAAYIGIVLWWQKQQSIDPAIKFHETWAASFMHLLATIMIPIAIFILIRKRGWLQNVIGIALFFLFLGEFLFLINYATDRIYDSILCPIGNSFHIWAVPLFGYVYFREQAIEKKQADAALKTYREHLEELVAARTGELTRTNKQLQQEIEVRMKAESEIAQRNAELAAQNAIVATLSQSLDLDVILDTALERTLTVLGVEAGCIYLVDPIDKNMILQVYHGEGMNGTQERSTCLCQNISEQAMSQRKLITSNRSTNKAECGNSLVIEKGLMMLVSTPLESKGRVVGALTLGARNPEVIVPQKQELLTAVSQQIGMAVENARLHKQLEQTAALEERQRIAANMHDGLAQTLSYLGMKTDRTAEMLELGQISPALNELPQMQDAIVRAIDDVRRSISSLQEPPRPRQSLQNTLAQLIENVSTEDKPIVTLQTNVQTPLFLEPDELEQVLHIVQEALINALRHAQAEVITIRLQKQNINAIIIIEDDGKGFMLDGAVENKENHFGLSIMQVRASQIGGQVDILSNLGLGTQIRLSWSLNQPPPNIQLRSGDHNRDHKPSTKSYKNSSLESANAKDTRVIS